MADKIKIAICDDAEFLCDGFLEQISFYSEFEAVGQAHSGAECIAMVEDNDIDVLMLDIVMETKTAGIDIIPELKLINSNLKIIMLTSYTDDDYVFSAFANGADDYCEKSLSIEERVEIIHNVYNNTVSLRPEIAKKLVSITKEIKKNQISLLYMFNKIMSLSTGEYELLRELYYGGSYKQIANDKSIEYESVKKMASRILKRLEAKSMRELITQLHDFKVFEFIDYGKK